MQCSLFITSDSLWQVESLSSRRIKKQINWNSVEVFCLTKTILYNSFMLISVKQIAAESYCVTVGSGPAVPRNCQNIRSSVAVYGLQNCGPRNGRTPPSCCVKGAGFLLGGNLKVSLKSHWYTQSALSHQ